jgi:hypothetical protein
VSVFTEVGSEKVKMWKKVNVSAGYGKYRLQIYCADLSCSAVVMFQLHYRPTKKLQGCGGQ